MITENGARLANRICSGLESCTVLIKGRDFDKLFEAVAKNFSKYEALIFITATGIAVRMIVPHIVSKLNDPAVLVIDEAGRHVISLLSGHVGGANELTLKVAALIEADPVITTATDVNNLTAVDSFSRKIGVKPKPKEAIKVINAAILRGEPVFVTAGETVLNLTPLKLIAGIGCKRGTPREAIESAVSEACKKINQPVERIDFLASVELKRDEIGLLEFAKSLRREIKFMSVEELQRTVKQYNLSESKFVKQTVGVGNICEAAALSIAVRGRVVLPKTKFESVTVALIWSEE